LPNIGHNILLTPEEIELALKECAFEKLRARGNFPNLERGEFIRAASTHRLENGSVSVVFAEE